MREFLLYARLEPEVAEAWIEAGWLLPQRQAGALSFTEADIARAALIRDLKEDLGVNEDGIGIVLDLLDQLHGVRRTLRSLVACLNEQPDDIRSRVLARLPEVAAGTGPTRRTAKVPRKAARTSRR
jgi:chaperone modulatory protein CbpM